MLGILRREYKGRKEENSVLMDENMILFGPNRHSIARHDQFITELPQAV